MWNAPRSIAQKIAAESLEALIDEPELGEAVKDYFRRWVSKLQSIRQALELPILEAETP